MKIYHRIDFEPEHNVESILDELNIEYDKLPFVNRYLIRFQMAESDERWLQIQSLMHEKGVVDFAFDTEFSQEEILQAEWLRMFGFPHVGGYPQPERRWQKEQPNYDPYCSSCGTFRQIDSFFLKKEPTLRTNDFMSLHWTSAIFAVPRVFEALESNGVRGWEKWPAILYKSKESSTRVAQLHIPNITKPGLVDGDVLAPHVCPYCGEVKYHKHHKRGVMYFKREAIVPDVDMMETYEWFGEGFQPRREVFVSNRVAQLAYAEGWKGVAFKVVELV